MGKYMKKSLKKDIIRDAEAYLKRIDETLKKYRSGEGYLTMKFESFLDTQRIMLEIQLEDIKAYL